MSEAPIGLLYGSTTCYTEMAAEKIQETFGSNADGESRVQLHDIKEAGLTPLETYQYLILGIPTWDYGELQEDWELAWPGLDDLDLSGKTIALYGCGDQIGYPEWFQDAVGYLHDKVRDLGARTIGYWPAEGYQFDSSMALTEDGRYFVGLALDEENEFELSEERIQQWCEQLREEFARAGHDG